MPTWNALGNINMPAVHCCCHLPYLPHPFHQRSSTSSGHRIGAWEQNWSREGTAPQSGKQWRRPLKRQKPRRSQIEQLDMRILRIWSLTRPIISYSLPMHGTKKNTCNYSPLPLVSLQNWLAVSSSGKVVHEMARLGSLLSCNRRRLKP